MDPPYWNFSNVFNDSKVTNSHVEGVNHPTQKYSLICQRSPHARIFQIHPMVQKFKSLYPQQGTVNLNDDFKTNGTCSELVIGIKENILLFIFSKQTLQFKNEKKVLS